MRMKNHPRNSVLPGHGAKSEATDASALSDGGSLPGLLPVKGHTAIFQT